ncbi:DUF4340 domain-containing protein [Caproicibacterium sp. BJN0003]|uniref:DUF4340 domain-containing protein n=1 Tax=Caproicibacterium sp. BJN0003 TaxID=2994078 RepID=UPI002259FE33|nr:DUF4340 domain-containing protein [Caproicibacterium sp. BJN0003]UZT82342.1 DUF4340 domain-containing protein [Caproicibacterium sp. BJN0003]
MKSSPKNKFVILGILAVALIAVIAALNFSGNRSGNSASSSVSTTEISLLNQGLSNLKQIEVQNSNGSYTLVRDESATEAAQSASSGGSTDPVFTIKELAGYDLDSTAVKAAAQNGCALSASKAIDISSGSSGTSGFGLENPLATMKMTYEDGSSATLLIGGQPPLSESSRYVQLEGSDTIYIAGIEDAILGDKSIFLSKQLTNLTSASSSVSVQKLNLKNKNGTIEILPTSSGDSYTVNGQPGDHDKIAALGNQLGDTSAVSVTVMNPTTDQLKSYGLDSPASVVSFTINGESHTFKIGNLADSRYALMMDDRPVIYQLSASGASWITASALTYRQLNPISQKQEDTASLKAEGNSSVYNFSAAREIDENSSTEDNSTYKYTYSLNGTTLSSSDNYLSFWSSFQNLKITDEGSPISGTPEWTFTLTGYDGSKTIYTFYKVSDSQETVAVNGTVFGNLDRSDFTPVIEALTSCK